MKLNRVWNQTIHKRNYDIQGIIRNDVHENRAGGLLWINSFQTLSFILIIRSMVGVTGFIPRVNSIFFILIMLLIRIVLNFFKTISNNLEIQKNRKVGI